MERVVHDESPHAVLIMVKKPSVELWTLLSLGVRHIGSGVKWRFSNFSKWQLREEAAADRTVVTQDHADVTKVLNMYTLLLDRCIG